MSRLRSVAVPTVAAIMGGAAVAGLGWAVLPRDAAATPQQVKVKAHGQPLKPCATEDSVGPCYWDAAKRGNGKGASFTVTADGTVYYWVEDPNPYLLGVKEWRQQLKWAGFSQLKPNPFPEHGECWAVIPDGDTSVVVCRDGYAETS